MGAEPTGRAAETLLAGGERVGPEPCDVGRRAGRRAPPRGRAAGFGVVFRPRDERVDGIRACLETRKRAGGRYWRLADAMDALITHKRTFHSTSRWRAPPCCSTSAFRTPIRLWMSLYLDACFFANVAEESELESECLRRLPDSCVEYVGREPRLSPRAEAKRTLDSQSPALAQPALR